MRVFVGMSGGVDSSVTAELLVKQGHDVTGIYMKNWSQDLPGMKCPWAEDLADAKRVAVQLGIDFEVYDFEQEYRDKVVGYMIEEYSLGRTPNPDIMCNQEVKFKLFFDAAIENGADAIATGHYARTKNGRLYLAQDTAKDQTYFLTRVSGGALTQTVFPLGDYTKQEVRDMAARSKLFTARKKESMGVCFVGQVGMHEFLSQYVTTAPGDVIDNDTSAVVGRHDGAIFYTLGQRHGLQLGGGLPYYVVGKDMDKNQVFVSRNLHSAALWLDTCTLEAMHSIHDQITDGNYLARTRHRAPLVEVSLHGHQLSLKEPQRAVTPGQSVALYDGEECVGGGIVGAA
jgi:tRNA-specific 2-thiouridylase